MMGRALGILLVAAVLGGCGDTITEPTDNSGNTGNVNGANGNTMTVTFDGVLFNHGAVSAVLNTANGTTPELLSVSTSNAALDTFTMTTPAAAGTYPISGVTTPTGANANLLVVASGASWSANAASGSGSITVLTRNGRTATGRFTLTMPPTSLQGAPKVADGNFSVNF